MVCRPKAAWISQGSRLNKITPRNELKVIIVLFEMINMK